MAFRYINPGYISLLDKNVVATEIAGTTYSKTGVSFTQTNSNAGITIPNFAAGDDFWAKFDVYITESADIYFYVPSTEKCGMGLRIFADGTTRLDIYYYSKSTSSVASPNNIIKLNEVNTIILHVKLGSAANSLWEVSINGTVYQQSGYSMPYSTSYKNCAILYATASIRFSNIIFSNEEISSKEQCIALPINQTMTDMTTGASGIYIANAANQSLLQSVDVAELIQTFGANSAVTGIALFGNPAYKTAAGLANLTALSKAGDSVIEHDTLALSGDSTALIVDGWRLSGVTISDLQNMQFGWKVKE